MTSKPTFPDREKRRELRRRGIVSWGRAASRCVVTVATLGTLLVMVRGVSSTKDLVAHLSGSMEFEDTSIRVVFGAGAVVAFTSVVAIGAGLIAALLQTGLFPSFSVLTARRSTALRRGLFRWGFGVQLLGILGGILLATYFWYRYTPELVLLWRRSDDTLVADVTVLVRSWANVAVVVGGVLAILACVATRVRYLFAHRTDGRRSSRHE